VDINPSRTQNGQHQHLSPNPDPVEDVDIRGALFPPVIHASPRSDKIDVGADQETSSIASTGTSITSEAPAELDFTNNPKPKSSELVKHNSIVDADEPNHRGGADEEDYMSLPVYQVTRQTTVDTMDSTATRVIGLISDQETRHLNPPRERYQRPLDNPLDRI